MINGEDREPRTRHRSRSKLATVSTGDEKAGRRVHDFHLIIDAVTGVPENDMENVADLVEVGEWEVALENLCTQLYEYGAIVPRKRYGGSRH